MRRLSTPVAACLVLSLCSLALTSPGVAQRTADTSTPPATAIIPQRDTLAGEIRVDNYSWLRDDQRKRPEVLDHLKAENAYTEAVMAHTKPLQERLFREMVGHIKETDLSVPELVDGYYYYSRTGKGKQYSIFCRKRGSLRAAEEVLLDENAIAAGHGYSRVESGR
jgi:oligopeptidase B